MDASRSFLVVGATGLVGGAATRKLRGLGADVRALVRGDLNRPAVQALTQTGVEVLAGDLGDSTALRRACADVDTVICTATAMPNASGDALQRVDHDGVLALIEAAEHAGVRRVVYISYSGNIRTDSPLGRAKRACEARLARSTVQGIVLRPSFFMQVWLGPHLGIDVQGGRARIFGDGSALVSYVSTDDVAAFIVAAATRPAEAGEVIDIGGPRPLSQLDAVAAFERLSGRRLDREHVPMTALEARHRSPDPQQQTFAALMIACALGDQVPDAAGTAARHGVTLTSLEEFAEATLRRDASTP